MWPYDRPASLKRTHATLDPYPIMDYYTHLQVPAPKYMKPEPIAYYQYPEDPERYQASITVSVQSHVNPFSSTSTSAIAYSPSTQYSSYSSSPIPATLPATTSYPINQGSSSSASSAAVAVGGVAYSVHTGAAMCGASAAAVGMAGSGVGTICCLPDPQQAMSSCSPVRSAMGDESTNRLSEHCTNAIGTPLTPPLSVSPPISSSPTPRQSISPQPSNTYLEKEPSMGYRSSTSSPCIPDCDSTTNASELPLQMLSELSEGLPLTGTCV